MSILIDVNVKAPMPKMHPRAAEPFNKLRQNVKDGAGFDFLAVCGDISRASDFTSTKDGVANRSWHKTGRAFDYDQNCRSLVIVSDVRNGRQYFRTYLRCAKQDGSLGAKMTVKDYRGNKVTAYLFDFTAAAEEIGFKRIPAWNGWQTRWNRKEFWHYQFDEGLTWDAAMMQLLGKSRPADDGVIGLNDRGDEVRKIQSRLSSLGFLPANEVDGVFGAKSKAAVTAFQKANGLGSDGLVGPNTRAKLFT